MSWCRLTANVSGFEADAIYHRYINSVRDRMRALNRPPGVVLSDTEFGLLSRMPTYRRRIKQYIRALQCGKPCAFGIPLIPADKGPQPAGTGVKRAKSEVAWCEIKLLVIERVIGNMHLPVKTTKGAVFVE